MRKRFAKVANCILMYLVHVPVISGCYLFLKIKYPDAVERFDKCTEVCEPLLYRTDMMIMRLLDKIEGQGHHWADNYDANFSLAGLNKGE